MAERKGKGEFGVKKSKGQGAWGKGVNRIRNNESEI